MATDGDQIGTETPPAVASAANGTADKYVVAKVVAGSDAAHGSPGDSRPDGTSQEPTGGAAGLKLVIELAPLAVWLVAFKFAGIIPATKILVVATLLSVLASYFVLRKISPMLIVTTVLVVVFGGLTIGFNDPHFIKIKPTVVNLLFAGALGYGLYSSRNFLKMALGEAMHLTPEGWRLLTLRWVGLFVVQAALNEIIWRATDSPELEHLWVYYKFPGMFLLTLIFTLINIPFVRQHSATSNDA